MEDLDGRFGKFYDFEFAFQICCNADGEQDPKLAHESYENPSRCWHGLGFIQINK